MDSGIEKRTWRNSRWTAIIGSFALILAFLFFALRRPPPHQHDPAEKCRSRLSQIELIKKMWAEDEGKSTNDVPTEADLYGTNDHLRVICPAGGTYTIGPVGEKPRCSIPGHTI